MTMPTRRRKLRGSMSRVSAPCSRTPPLVGSSSRFSMRSRVLLPAPLGPKHGENLSLVEAKADIAQQRFGAARLIDRSG